LTIACDWEISLLATRKPDMFSSQLSVKLSLPINGKYRKTETQLLNLFSHSKLSEYGLHSTDNYPCIMTKVCLTNDDKYLLDLISNKGRPLFNQCLPNGILSPGFQNWFNKTGIEIINYAIENMFAAMISECLKIGEAKFIDKYNFIPLKDYKYPYPKRWDIDKEYGRQNIAAFIISQN
jgi:hypothetical protein